MTSSYSANVGPLEYNSNLSYYNQKPNSNPNQQQQHNISAASYPTSISYGNQPSSSYSQYSGQMSTDWNYSQSSPFDSTINSNGLLSNDFSDEPPLLEELGINPKDIIRKTLAVSIPFKKLPQLTEEQTDLAGPLVYCLLLGCCLLLTGKLHFGYIYGFGMIGCLLMYFILSLMSDELISFDRTMSILGYSLLPIVFLSFLNIFLSLKSWIGFGVSIFIISWCTSTAVRMFEAALQMAQQRWLIAYPIGLLYACFVILTIF